MGRNRYDTITPVLPPAEPGADTPRPTPDAEREPAGSPTPTAPARRNTPPVRAPLSPLDPGWRAQLLPDPGATPLQVLLDPGQSLAAAGAAGPGGFGAPLTGAMLSTELPSLSRLEVLHLLELPELPAHRAPRGPEEDASWRRLSPRERGRHDAPLVAGRRRRPARPATG